jgi:hypothetical protein
MARHPEGSEPISQVETQWEGIKYEGPHSAPGGVTVCVSYVEYFASTNGIMSAMCWRLLARPRLSSLTAMLEDGNLPQDDSRIPAMLEF